MGDEILKADRKTIAVQVQDMLVSRLQKHEIATDRAKAIARAVVDALKKCESREEVEHVLPDLSTEFIELRDVIETQDDLCRHDIEHRVSAFVHKLITTGKFAEAHTLMEDTFKKLAEKPFRCAETRSEIEFEYNTLTAAPLDTSPGGNGTHPAASDPQIPSQAPQQEQTRKNVSTDETLVPQTRKSPPSTVENEFVPSPEETLLPIKQNVLPAELKQQNPSPVVRDFHEPTPPPAHADRVKHMQTATNSAVEKTHAMRNALFSFGKNAVNRLSNAVFSQLDNLKNTYEKKQKGDEKDGF